MWPLLTWIWLASKYLSTLSVVFTTSYTKEHRLGQCTFAMSNSLKKSGIDHRRYFDIMLTHSFRF